MTQSEWSLDFAPSEEISFDGASAIHKTIASIPYSQSNSTISCLCCNKFFFANKNVLYYCEFGNEKIEQFQMGKTIIRLTSLEEGIVVISEDYITVFNVKNGLTQKCRYSNCYKIISHESVLLNGKAVFYMTDLGIIVMSWPAMEIQPLLSFSTTNDVRIQKIKEIVGEEELKLVSGISMSAFVCFFEKKAVVVTTSKILEMNVSFEDPIVECFHNRNRLFVRTQKELFVFEQKITSLEKLTKLGSWKIPENCKCRLNQFGATFINDKTCVCLRWINEMKVAHFDRIVFGSNFVDIALISPDYQIISKTFGGFLKSEIPDKEKAELRQTKKSEGKKEEELVEKNEIAKSKEFVEPEEVQVIPEENKQDEKEIKILVVRSDNFPTSGNCAIIASQPEEVKTEEIEEEARRKVEMIKVEDKLLEEEEKKILKMKMEREKMEARRLEKEKEREEKLRKKKENKTVAVAVEVPKIEPTIEKKPAVAETSKPPSTPTTPVPKDKKIVKVEVKKETRKENEVEKEIKQKVLKEFKKTNKSLANLVKFFNGLEEKPYCSELPEILKGLKL